MNNVQSRSRADRIYNKDKVEQDNINKRDGYISRNIDAKTLLYHPDKNSCQFQDQKERFDKDFNIFDKTRREQKFERVQNFMEQNRIKVLEREQQHWSRYNDLDLKDTQRMQLKSERSYQGKRNINYQGFDPINQNYNQNKIGKTLEVKDLNDQVNYLIRQNNLSVRNNQRYNIISGEEKTAIKVPMQLQQSYDKKIQQQRQYYQEFQKLGGFQMF